MAGAYSTDLRSRALAAVETGESPEAVAQRFLVGRSTVYRWWAAHGVAAVRGLERQPRRALHPHQPRRRVHHRRRVAARAAVHAQVAVLLHLQLRLGGG